MAVETNPMPLVTVGVPLYNHEKFIRECLDSIISDSYPNKEIIILDDGSTDSSLAVVKQWINDNNSERCVLKLISRNNRGICKTFNEIIAMANGEYICFVASDDYLLPTGIHSRIEYLQNNPEKLAVFGDCTVIDDQSKILFKSGIEDRLQGRKRYLVDKRLLPIEMIIHWCPSGSVLLMNRNAFLRVGNYDETLMVEDLDFYLRLIAPNILGFVDHPVCAYRIHGTNTCLNEELTEHIHNAVYKTIEKNICHFSGLQRLFLLAWRWSSFGVISKIKGYHFYGYYFINAGRILRGISNLFYTIKSLMIFNTTRKSDSQ